MVWWQGGGGVDAAVAEASCPLVGFRKDGDVAEEMSSGKGKGVAKLAMAGSWRTNLTHRLK